MLNRSVAEVSNLDIFVVSSNGTRVVNRKDPNCSIGLLSEAVKPNEVLEFPSNLFRIHFGLSGSKAQSTKFISSASQMASAHVPRHI